MNLSKREMIFVSMGALVIVTALAWRVIASRSASAGMASSQTLRGSMDRIDRYLALRRTMDRLTGDLKVKIPEVGPDDQEKTMREEIDRMAGRNGMKLSSIRRVRTGSRRRSETVQTIQFRLDVTGKFGALMGYVYDLENGSIPFVIRDIKIDKSSRGSGQGGPGGPSAAPSGQPQAAAKSGPPPGGARAVAKPETAMGGPPSAVPSSAPSVQPQAAAMSGPPPGGPGGAPAGTRQSGGRGPGGRGGSSDNVRATITLQTTLFPDTAVMGKKTTDARPEESPDAKPENKDSPDLEEADAMSADDSGTTVSFAAESTTEANAPPDKIERGDEGAKDDGAVTEEKGLPATEKAIETGEDAPSVEKPMKDQDSPAPEPDPPGGEDDNV